MLIELKVDLGKQAQLVVLSVGRSVGRSFGRSGSFIFLYFLGVGRETKRFFDSHSLVQQKPTGLSTAIYRVRKLSVALGCRTSISVQVYRSDLCGNVCVAVEGVVISCSAGVYACCVDSSTFLVSLT